MFNPAGYRCLAPSCGCSDALVDCPASSACVGSKCVPAGADAGVVDAGGRDGGPPVVGDGGEPVDGGTQDAGRPSYNLGGCGCGQAMGVPMLAALGLLGLLGARRR
jgi:uncharacterized protein (TIGR03382 family)